MRLVVATGNAGKLAEFRELFAALPDAPAIELLSLADLNLPQSPETGSTFVENALQKARHAARASELPCLADDSGLVVSALRGAPGIHSARYAGGAEGSRSDQANNERLLTELNQLGDAGQNRRAYFYCVLVLIRHAEDPAPLLASGRWHGEIASQARGSNGFGYDPLFLPAGETRSAAELQAGEKHRLSHRGRAWRTLVQQFGDL